MTKEQKSEFIYKMLTHQSNKSINELREILNGEIKLIGDNPKLRLSIKDYELMCKNRILRNIMAKVLNTDIKSLTNFCIITKKVGDYIDLSLKTINEKNNAKSSPIITLLTDIPDDSKKLIIDHYKSLLKYELRDWIKEEFAKLDLEELSSNFNAIDFLSLPENNKYINWDKISKNRNPKALLLIDKKIMEENLLPITEYENLATKINWHLLSENPIAIKLLKQEYKKNPKSNRIDYEELSFNTSDEAIELLKVNKKKIDWVALSYNKSLEAIELLKENFNNIDWSSLSFNTSDDAIELLKENYDNIDWISLSGNKNPNVIPLINEKIKEENKLYKLSPTKYNNLENKVDWRSLSSNPNEKAIKILKENYDNIDWGRLSSNSSDEAIQLLKANYDNIDWKELSGNRNPNALSLINKKIKEENKLYKLSPTKYNNLENKIWWRALSGNPNRKAIELLKNNKDKIYWPALSANPSIFVIN